MLGGGRAADAYLLSVLCVMLSFLSLSSTGTYYVYILYIYIN
jgi:hypothetical protein